MRALLVIFTLLLFVGCGTRKKQFEASMKAEFEAFKKQYSHHDLETETRWYGDSLSGTAYFPVGEVQYFDVESSGVKLSGTITPVSNKDGNQIGSKLNYNATAKPKGQTNSKEKLTSQEESSSIQSIEGNEKLDDEVDRPTVSGYLMESLITLAIVAVIGLFLWYKFKKNVKIF